MAALTPTTELAEKANIPFPGAADLSEYIGPVKLDRGFCPLATELSA